HAKKSELLRAGIAVLAAMDDASLLSALQAVPPLKTGRPKTETPAEPAAESAPAAEVVPAAAAEAPAEAAAPTEAAPAQVKRARKSTRKSKTAQPAPAEAAAQPEPTA
ncbi:MAG: hypothetical protein RJA44_997, partial [Pseudomonadota bacterium]